MRPTIVTNVERCLSRSRVRQHAISKPRIRESDGSRTVLADVRRGMIPAFVYRDAEIVAPERDPERHGH